MPLTIGTRLGPYEIVSAIGAVGMGVFNVSNTITASAGKLVAVDVPHTGSPSSFAACSCALSIVTKRASRASA